MGHVTKKKNGSRAKHLFFFPSKAITLTIQLSPTLSKKKNLGPTLVTPFLSKLLVASYDLRLGQLIYPLKLRTSKKKFKDISKLILS